MLERYFHAKAAETGKYTIINRWWDRKDENEIDMIAANEIGHTAEIYEIKRQRKNIDMAALDEKVKAMLPQISPLKDFDVHVSALDMEDM